MDGFDEEDLDGKRMMIEYLEEEKESIKDLLHWTWEDLFPRTLHGSPDALSLSI